MRQKIEVEFTAPANVFECRSIGLSLKRGVWVGAKGTSIITDNKDTFSLSCFLNCNAKSHVLLAVDRTKILEVEVVNLWCDFLHESLFEHR